MSIRPLLIAGLLIATPLFALPGHAEDDMAKEKAAEAAPADALPDADVKKIKVMFKSANKAPIDADFDKWQSYWTDDAVLMPPGQRTVKGHEALIAFAEKHLAKMEDFKLSKWTIEGTGTLGW